MAAGTSDNTRFAPQFTTALWTREKALYGSQVILHRKKW
jgi:hypothetical protein